MANLVETGHTFFIGSGIYIDPGTAASLTCSFAEGRHLPQTPQEGLLYGMNGEATNYFPLVRVIDGKIAYDCRIHPNQGDQSGIIEAWTDDQVVFEIAVLLVDELWNAVQARDKVQQDAVLTKLVQEFPDFDWTPPAFKPMVKELKQRLEADKEREQEPIWTNGENPFIVKLQESGFITTAAELYAYNADTGMLEKGLILGNEQMLKFHTGLIYARSLLWTRHLKSALKEEFADIDVRVVFSMDEPDLARMDEAGQPRWLTMDNVYNWWWGEDKRELLDYDWKMNHVCGNFRGACLPYADLLNFEWNTAALFKSEKDSIRKFVERGGKLVAGIIPVEEADLVKAVPELDFPGNQVDVNVLLNSPALVQKLIDVCVKRAYYIVSQLEAIGFTREEALKCLAISPVCGLGGLIKYPRERAAEYTRLVYLLTQEVADRVFNPRVEKQLHNPPVEVVVQAYGYQQEDADSLKP